VAGAAAGSLTFANLVEFDSLYGHRRDVSGYARHLEWADAALGPIIAARQPGDLMLITADHGNDPTWPGTDHTRERVPVLGAGLGPRAVGLVAFADLAARAQPGDFVYLHFSGHGSQAPALDPATELDGLDELFLPVDIGPWNDSIGTVENGCMTGMTCGKTPLGIRAFHFVGNGIHQVVSAVVVACVVGGCKYVFVFSLI
jgi:hypothetical protein